jgi:non-canonical poly(A) RNA polymerase PAPD5/7
MPPPAYEFRGQRGDRRSRPNHEFTFRYPRPTSERPLLTSKRETTPELLLGQSESETKAPLRFAALDQLTDSDEAEMDVSSEDEDGSRPPRKKRAVETDTAKERPAPKWSNPDPYTVLPPLDETQTKRPDVVKLIRKARVAATSAVTQTDAVTTNEDFISFDMDDLDGVEEAPEPPANAPKGPRNADVSGKRKRTHDDEIKGYSKKSGKPFGDRFRSDGGILDQWRRTPSESGAPWLELMEPTLHLGTRSAISPSIPSSF